MDLVHVKTLFLKITGRNDLVVSTEIGWNFNFFINQAQRMLDKKFDTPKTLARQTMEMAVGEFYKHIKDLRVIEEVWFATSEGRTQLKRKSAAELRGDYPLMYASLSTSLTQGIKGIADETGAAEFWTPIVIGLAPDRNQPQNTEFHYDNDGILLGDHYRYKGIMVFPATDTAGTLSILGKFYSPALDDDADKSYWTEVEPMVLAWATAYMMEVSYRNTEGANDWWAQIVNSMMGTDDDLAEESAMNLEDLENV